MLASLQSPLVSGTGQSSHNEEERAKSLSQKGERKGIVEGKKKSVEVKCCLAFIMLS